MPLAEIITIGSEIMLGEIVDTNAPYLARKLRDLGVEVRRTWSIGDHVDDIADAIREATRRVEIILTTGGLGPTVDDPTREGVARAFGVPLEFQENLWQQVLDRFARFGSYPSDNNKRQAFLPRGARPIENPVGTAPAFCMEYPSPAGKGAVICLPGVPREMEHLLETEVIPYLRAHFSLNTITIVRTLHTAGVGESRIDERIGDLEKLTNPVVGLAAHSGQVDVRITARAPSAAEARMLIQQVEEEVRRRLGNWIYGADDETLEDQAVYHLASRGWRMVVVEAGLAGKLLRRFAHQNEVFLRGETLPAPLATVDELLQITQAYRQTYAAEVGLGVAISTQQGAKRQPNGSRPLIFLVLLTPEGEKVLQIPFGGPPQLAHRRAVNYGLDLLRKIKGNP